MSEFRYSSAERCTECAMRAVIPTEHAADRLVTASHGRLMKYQCPIDGGWHLSYPAAEHTGSKQ